MRKPHRPANRIAPRPVSRRDSLSPARVVAFGVLRDLEKPGSPPLDELLLAAKARHVLSPADWRLCYQIAQGVTRHRDCLDAALAEFLKAGGKATAQPILIALRMAAFQHLFLDRIPMHAIVNETVDLVRVARFPDRACGFANAVARRLVELDPEAALFLPANAARADVLQRFSIPHWIGREIEHAYGRGALRAECEALAQPAPLDLRVNPLRGEASAIRERVEREVAAAREGGPTGRKPMAGRSARQETPGRSTHPTEGGVPGGSGVEPHDVEPGRFCPDVMRLQQGLDFTGLAAFREGLVTPQDEAAALVCHWVGARPGMRIADFCAAPGGKTAYLAALMQNQGWLWALDADPWRLAKVEENCARLGVTCVEPAVNTPETRARWIAPPAGAPSSPAGLASAALDAALVDPPCTNLGTLRRHPDAKWRHRSSDPRAMANRQLAILREAAPCVRPGGVIVYSVCTFTKPETVDVIDSFLKLHRDWRRDVEFTPPPFIPAEWRTASGDWLTRTSRDGLDGFFVARLVRLPGPQ